MHGRRCWTNWMSMWSKHCWHRPNRRPHRDYYREHDEWQRHVAYANATTLVAGDGALSRTLAVIHRPPLCRRSDGFPTNFCALNCDVASDPYDRNSCASAAMCPECPRSVRPSRVSIDRLARVGCCWQWLAAMAPV